MNSTYNITQAQKQLPRIVRSLKKEGVVGITVHNQTNAFLISSERMEAIAETMDILSNQLAIEALNAYNTNSLKMIPLDEIN